jgi:hypothetical protein
MPYLCGHSHTHRARYAPERAAGGGFTERNLPEKPSQPARDPTHEEIAAVAYSYWEARGYRGGSALEDWLRAERELKTEK